METNEVSLLDSSMLIRLRLKAFRTDRRFTERPEPLPDDAILPCLSNELAGRQKFAQVRLAVGADALFLQCDVQGKRQLPWCRDSRLEDSDVLHVWIDTRNTRDVQRATKYCSRFGLLPMGSGPKADLPYIGWVPIQRAKDNPPQPPWNLMTIRSRIAEGVYRMVAAIHFDALHGIDPNDFPIVGFYFAVIDREQGWQSLSVAPDGAVVENPSLWAQLVL